MNNINGGGGGGGVWGTCVEGIVTGSCEKELKGLQWGRRR